MSVWRPLVVLGLCHGVADAVSGFAIASFLPRQTIADIGIVLLAYNLVAFGLQPAFGYMTDRLRRPWAATVAGFSLLTAGIMIFAFAPLIGIACVAIGSGMFHAGAGAISSLLTPGQSVGTAMFSAPGVMGLALGTVAALRGWPFLFPLILLSTIASSFLVLTRTPELSSGEQDGENTWGHLPSGAELRGKDEMLSPAWVATALLVAVATRSAVWSIYGLEIAQTTAILLAGIAAGAGKFIGGLAADTFGRRMVTCAGIAAAAGCFLPASLPWTILGLFFLQSSMPVVLSAFVQRFSRFPATASGLVLGLAILLGGALAYALSLKTIVSTSTILELLGVAFALFFVGMKAVKH